MTEKLSHCERRLRIGAVNYLNTKPLIYGLADGTCDVQLMLDLPSRLAESLSTGRVDVALIPSIELFRNSAYRVVSDACIACRGPVLSVKLYFRVPPSEVRRLALDEGSRTSVALAQVLLEELCDVSPKVESLPIGAGINDTDADAVLLIGDRAVRSVAGTFVDVWDLGDRWCRWAKLPFVFAMWVARPEADVDRLARLLSKSREEGIAQLPAIAAREAALLGIEPNLALQYLQDNLHFTLGSQERRGFERFYQLCAVRGLVPLGREQMIHGQSIDDCTVI